eukprot:CAMPEP_0175286594 /NCGR_PEP_ID=MMETSP0093-20121207/53839_1 /TAXON_ID=311494 /ORGANISM="Alexandrium monilatum, Strain CCMP3105" /LENGTH=67 /DNA_ID=CAMNT_0016582055 /DNA_START=21 /DNA_END=221 /DNA_ORIENTATION=+
MTLQTAGIMEAAAVRTAPCVASGASRGGAPQRSPSFLERLRPHGSAAWCLQPLKHPRRDCSSRPGVK